ncbi:hypothetical protein AALO_G00158480 [Alosa alosa]|uniref:Uncharacterized protein n=1 Tax=Alosa alosa TaxID=278164 RepID=A0AAV6GFR2_9TELE|nr:hypothetical protein AALO_G00158480 [Alosa alosa]
MSVSVSVPRETQQSSVEVPSTYYCWSVFNRWCCCWLFGREAKKHSKEVERCIAAGDLLGAQKASESAFSYNLAALIIGLILWVIIVCLYVFQVYYRIQN